MLDVSCWLLGILGKHSKSFAYFPPLEYKVQPKKKKKMNKQKKKPEIAHKVMPLTVVFLGMIIFNNLCLKYVEVSFYQVARSLTIVFNVIFTYCLLAQQTDRNTVAWCIAIIVGYLMGCDGEVHFSIIGVVFGVLSSAFVALNSIYVKKILPIVDESSEKLMMYNNINAVLILLPIIYFFTVPSAFLKKNGSFSQKKNGSTFFLTGGYVDETFAQDEFKEIDLNNHVFGTSIFWTLTIVAGIVGYLINFASYLQIKYTSPLSHNVSGTAKAAAQTVIALLVFRNPVTAQGMLGVIVVILASFGYSRPKQTS
ncbi:GDP-L-fucose transporter [Reticulomyxa filosa]|uniref:GDP-L-fucose transporter n=1 Tax=Reticulomyxa filosa TaxID=46433 RepID=X6P5M7_RETFI|nr:GDP-L-fucose transporter [Reticulomyxa filosa]|eukprot:ETO32902.1 GDP-L-fucose transporter [Reticulomyxa filosa]